MKQQGTVKWFSAPKGYGFITISGGKDLFVHHTSLQMEGYRELKQDQIVEFEEAPSPKGPMAINVRVVAERAA